MAHFVPFCLVLFVFRAAASSGAGLVFGGIALVVIVLVAVVKSVGGGSSGSDSLTISDGSPEPTPKAVSRSRLGILPDNDFESAVQKLVTDTGCDKFFYSKVAGASHRNPDRTSRTRVIAECSVFENLELRPEPNNQFDANAMAICRKTTGEQLGYLEARLAEEVSRDFRKFGPCWLALFCHPNHHPETGKIAGAVIYMLRLPVHELQREEEEKGSAAI